jgi:hypothetical protein
MAFACLLLRQLDYLKAVAPPIAGLGASESLLHINQALILAEPHR